LHPIFPIRQKIASEILTITGMKNQLWIGIAPFTQYKSKMYPLPQMKKVIEELSKNGTYKILLFGGGEKEINVLNKLASNNENTINIAGKLSLEKELALISNLDVMLSMDSGNAHFAAMLGIKTITLWGITHPFAGFAPFNQPLTNCILPDLEKYPNIPCSIYGNKVCEGYENVMESITPKIIVNKILELV
jgi:ADP-heptose:LPS heptosyltransferase